MTKLNRKKATVSLRKLNWEDVHWLRLECEKLEGSAKGPRVYHAGRDSAADMSKAFTDHFDDILFKHHGI